MDEFFVDESEGTMLRDTEDIFHNNCHHLRKPIP